MCSPYTECGKTIITDQYGTNGNDCPEGLMCFGDIECMPPTGSPSIMPTITTLVPTIDIAAVATSSYCGSTYADAKQECTPSTICDTDDDCMKFGSTSRTTTNNADDDGDGWGGKTCFTNISCTVSWQNYEDAISLTTTTTTPTTASPPSPSTSSSSSSSSSSASSPTAGITEEIVDILQEGIAATSLLEGISSSSSTSSPNTAEITNNMKKTNTIIETNTPSIITTTSPTTDTVTYSITTTSLVDDYIIIESSPVFVAESSPVFEVDTDDAIVIDIATFQENTIGRTSGEVEGGGGSERNNDDNNEEYHEVAIGRPMENYSSSNRNNQEFVPKWPADYSSSSADGLLTLNCQRWSSVGIILLAVVLCR